MILGSLDREKPREHTVSGPLCTILFAWSETPHTPISLHICRQMGAWGAAYAHAALLVLTEPYHNMFPSSVPAWMWNHVCGLVCIFAGKIYSQVLFLHCCRGLLPRLDVSIIEMLLPKFAVSISNRKNCSPNIFVHLKNFAAKVYI